MLQSVRRFLRKTSGKVIALSLVLGLLVVGGNYYWFSSDQVIREDVYGADRAAFFTATYQQPVQLLFVLEDPGAYDEVVIEIEVRDAPPGAGMGVLLDGVRLQGISPILSGGVYKLTLEGSDVHRKNKLDLKSEVTYDIRNVVLERITISGIKTAERFVFVVVNLFALLMIAGPILYFKYSDFHLRDELEDRFPDFLRDIVEGARAGMSLTQAISGTRKSDYGKLSKYTNALIARLEWGLRFERSLELFAKHTRSMLIRRAVTTIIQTYQSGGKIADVLEVVGDNLKEIKKLRKERDSELFGQVRTGYVVFFVFLVVMIGLIRFLLPQLNIGGTIGLFGAGGLTSKELIPIMRDLLGQLIVIQSVFAGLVIGKLGEGSVKAGGKHIAILLTIGYTLFLLFA